MKRRNGKRMLLGAFFLLLFGSVLGSQWGGRPVETAAAQGLDGRAVTIRKTYTLSGQPVAQRTVEIDANGVIQSETLHTIYTDHLGSATALMDEPGNVVATQRFFPFGEHQSDPTPLTDRGFTGHLHNDDLGLIYMNARYYLPGVGRMLTPDTIVPDPAAPQSLNRYLYVQNNPVVHTDPSGHCIDGLSTWACIGIAIAAVTKAVDYGWTAWDGFQASRTIANPDSTDAERLVAGLNIGMAIVFEAIEPDDILPVGLPLDDVGRRAVLNGAQDAFEKSGREGFDKFIREQTGEHGDQILKHIDEALGLDPESLLAATQLPSGKQNFTLGGYALQKHSNRPHLDDVWAPYKPEGSLNPNNYNETASRLIEDILTNPNSTKRYYTTGGVEYVDYFAPDGRGLRFYLDDGRFKGFINP